ncbi:MAG TPA: ISAzo13 family transposase [Candidatus Lustribacter sp.]|nr:ISAzo13 family transposase [Candidatus Lustribacter sp.]
MIDEAAIGARFLAVASLFDERARRLLAGSEALAIGRGGVAAVARATGLARTTVARGVADVQAGETVALGRIRRAGAGRPPIEKRDPTLRADLEALIEPTSRGDPESPLRWTTRSVRNLAAELRRQGHAVSHQTISELLHDLGYSLQANRKTLEGTSHPDRDAQFRHINEAVQLQLALGEPVISVDTKKKELVGPFRNGGRELRPKGDPERVLMHDFVIPELGRASPYGVYDVAANEAWVSVGTDHDTAAFAVESIRRWWTTMGAPLYPEATRLLVTADAGGSNGYRLRLWKQELGKLADEIGLEIAVCHFPPGTSKWNKIEHRLFSAITQNWRGKPLVSHETVVNLIAATTTRTGLRVRSELDTSDYPAGLRVSDADMETLYLRRDDFHGEWNYSLLPRQRLSLTEAVVS